MQIFNAREIATAAWSICGIIFLIAIPKIRTQLLAAIKALFSRKLIVIYELMAIYVSLLIFLLFKSDLWNVGLLKDSFIWIFLAGIPSIFQTTKIKSRKKYFRHALGDVLRFTTIVEFLVNRYTFSLIAELIIVPISFFLFALLAFTEKGNKFHSAKRLLRFLITFFGMYLLLYALVKVIANFHDFATKETFDEFLIGPILSLGFIPFVYFLSLYMTYQSALILLNRDIKDGELERYARRKAVFYFKLNTDGLQRWRNSVALQSLISKSDIINSMIEITRLKKIEKDPPHILSELGWSPYRAKEFLSRDGIDTSYYKQIDNNEWSACSTYIKLDNNLIPNDIAYYVDGDSNVAKKLTLSLSVHSPENSIDAHEKLLGFAKSLHRLSLFSEMPRVIEKALRFGLNKTKVIGKKEISVVKNQWSNHLRSGYEMEFSILVKPGLKI